MRMCNLYYILVICIGYINISAPTMFENCDLFQCSNIFDIVCGLSKTKDGPIIVRKYQNICHLKKARCRQRYGVLLQIPDKFCKIKKQIDLGGRRVHDYSIVGAHKPCNHTCPTYCVDTYEPVCAQIWKTNMEKYKYRAMVNHCHVDLFSCALALNVTIQPLQKCYQNHPRLLFMQSVAALKSLKLLDLEVGNEPEIQLA